MKEAFVIKRFHKSSLSVIAQAISIIEEYRQQQFVLTLRQLYYQFVARGLMANTVRNYKKLGNIVSDARLAGLIDWDSIEDRTRKLEENNHWDSPAQIIEICSRQYLKDKWENQPNYCEVWIEKEALAGVIERICKSLDVPFFACRGYVSQSEQYKAGKRLEDKIYQGQEVHIFHLGDHDPSGIDMTRDNDERLDLFSGQRVDGVEVHRIALNMDQVERYNPPPNPAKTTDSRYEGYIQKFGEESWELDALDPNVLVDLISTNVQELIDWEKWDEVESQQTREKDLLKLASKNWGEVAEFLRERDS